MKPRKQHDTYPVTFTCKDDDGPVSLLNADSARFLMADSSGALKVDAAMDIDPDQVANPGKVSYSWAAGDVDTVGKFKVEIRILWQDETQSTFPSDSYESLVIIADLDDQ